MYYFFLKKILNVFQKNDKKPVLIPDFFFLRRFQKWKQNTKKLQRVLRGLFLFIYTVEKEKKVGMDTVKHTASTILVVQMVTKN